MKNISKLYYSTFGLFFQGARLYLIDLNSFICDSKPIDNNQFKFYMPTEHDLVLFTKLYENVPEKCNILIETFKSGNYLCFAYQDIANNRLAYARWVCKKEYFSDAMRKQLNFKPNEALTLDSYTHPDYRFAGLHKNMNIQMLQWLKINTQIRYVYMVILMFIPHLTKIPLELGYRPIESTFYYKKGSLSAFINLIKRKFNV
jgi:hypothetical protein